MWKETQITVGRNSRKSIIFWPILLCRITMVLHRIYTKRCAPRTADPQPSPALDTDTGLPAQSMGLSHVYLSVGVPSGAQSYSTLDLWRVPLLCSAGLDLTICISWVKPLPPLLADADVLRCCRQCLLKCHCLHFL